MIHLTQLVYIKEGQQEIFDQFEAVAIPSIKKYNGRLLLRIRPGSEQIIEQSIEPPYEIHLVEFETEGDFENFRKDPERQKFLHLKEQSVRSVLLIKGKQI
jgi:uncharacterized protein (DUF1330 family)